MRIRKAVPLSKYSTMRLGGLAAYLTEVKSRKDVVSAVAWADRYHLPVMMIGTGSNIVWSDFGYPGLVLVNRIKHFEIFKEDDGNIYLTVGAGENWDSVVKRAVRKGLSGIESLSYIPGTAGATPVQNVGAYGQEIADTLVNVEAYDHAAKNFVNIPKIDCGFGYRSSRFKTTDKGRFFITGMTLHLAKTNPKPPFYDTLQHYLDSKKITKFNPSVIRRAVIAIRTSKLPDPAKVATNGSFFANPIVGPVQFVKLEKRYPDIKYWLLKDGRVKLSAGWMMEKAGFKGYQDAATGMAIWPKQALTVVNLKAHSTRDLIEFRQKIIVKVRYLFGVTLEQEPEFVGEL